MSSLSEGTVPSQYSAAYETDMDSFFNLDSFPYQASDSTKSKPAITPSFGAPDFNINDFSNPISNPPSQIPFSGPSHQYDNHQQQTGLPTGSLAHARTFSDSPTMNIGLGFQNFNGDAISASIKQENTVNFATAPARTPSHKSVESASAFYRPSNTGVNQQFINPTALDGAEMSPLSQPTQVGRMYPGVHQQAAMARAQQQRQRDGRRQPQQHVQSQPEAPSRSSSLAHERHIRPTDPVVEERISRLLQQMRQKAIANQEDVKQPSNILPQIGKLKKDEDDMDEDERLLASEEGKKLSSKERRQLRNKVSARAFRSRRKEYISQLEGEVAAKTNEANELRTENRALLEENKSLTDLTRTLLSSPHFSSFMDELTSPESPLQQQTPPQQSQSQVVSDTPMRNAPPRDSHVPHNAQVGMVVVPEPTVDLSAMDITGSGWNSGIDMNFNHAPVFALLEVPEGPALDSMALSGKSSNFVDFSSSVCPKDEVRFLEFSKPLACEDSTSATLPTVVDSLLPVSVDTNDTSLTLFLDDAPTIPLPSKDAEDSLIGDLVPEKLFAPYVLVLENDLTDGNIARMRRFSRLCASIEVSFERVSLLTLHLL